MVTQKQISQRDLRFFPKLVLFAILKKIFVLYPEVDGSILESDGVSTGGVLLHLGQQLLIYLDLIHFIF